MKLSFICTFIIGSVWLLSGNIFADADYTPYEISWELPQESNDSLTAYEPIPITAHEDKSIQGDLNPAPSVGNTTDESLWERPNYTPYDPRQVQTDVIIESSYTTPKDNAAENESGAASASEQLSHAANNASKEKESAPYRLKIGDKIYISVYGEPKSGRITTVDPTGTISYLYVNSIYVLGKSINEVKKVLDDKIKDYFKHGVVTVSAVELLGGVFTIMGQVNNPGTKTMSGKTTVLTAIGQGEGFVVGAFRNRTIDYADLDHAFLARKGAYVPVDFNKLISHGDLSQDVELHDGDYIYIPNVVAKDIYVLGEVNFPIDYTFVGPVTLSEAITYAGGITNKASSRITIIRGSLACPVTFDVDFYRILNGYACDFTLEPGDIVYVPAMRFSTFKELVQMGIATYISQAANNAGTRAYISINPGATNLVQPFQVIGGGFTPFGGVSSSSSGGGF